MTTTFRFATPWLLALLAVGVVLIGIVLFFRKGLLGRVPWLP